MKPDLQPMDTNGVDTFIDHWHRAIAEEVKQEDEIATLTMLAQKLKATLRSNHVIRRLAANPLLCAVICALHRDTNERLPEDRLDLYERCCSMLLERRDRESDLDISGYPRLTYREKRVLLDDLAYWMVKNEWTEVPINSASDRLQKEIGNLRTDGKDNVPPTAQNVMRVLIDRTGMLREPVNGKLDFAHRTFQEYMAAKAALDEGDVGALVQNATNAQWREVIVLAAGLARPRERSELISALLTKGDADAKNRYQLHLLAAACLDSAIDLDSEIKTQVENRIKKLVPNTVGEAALLAASAGEMAVPFLKKTGFVNARQGVACVRALALIGSPEALQAIAEYADENSISVLREVLRVGDRTESSLFLQVVAPHII